MNKSDSKKINQIFALLTQAIDSVKDAAASGLSENGMYLLTNMQQITIEAGNILEEKEPECQTVVKKLETLCELYYQCSIIFHEPQKTEEQCILIKKLITELKTDIQQFPVRTEILFLPYQVSMWDSLESVWRAASQDEQTDCYVVPLPVYDVLVNNSLGELHYDGDLYPDDVPVTSYQEYDIEKRHPDIIFFHNPYDDANTVTRVPETYYSRNLKKCTDLLVYIPYYMAEDHGPAYYQCYTPGILFADKVIVQPGAIYQRTCGIYTNFIKQNGFDQILASAKDKFLPLGSPKTDKLANTKCEIENLPKQWQAAIQKTDGSKKKIVLYNLSISSLLENNEKTLKKIDTVLTQFKKLKDEIVLLWRPHPLLEKTLKSMRPQLRAAYETQICQYKKEGWGIFDETPDPNLAMAISDAYYGDYSSLLISYRILNKPMLLQNVNSSFFHPDDCKMQLWFYYQPVLIDGELWFTSYELNGLYRFPLLAEAALKTDVQTSKIEAKLEIRFDNEPNLQEGLFGNMIQDGNLLIFPPYSAKTIITYHTKTKKMVSYPLPAKIANIAKPKYHTGFICGHLVYFIGVYSDIEMIRLDLDTGNVERCGCIPDQVAGLNIAEIIGYCACAQTKIYIPLTTARAIVEYDLETSQSILKKLPQKYAGQLKGIFCYTKNEFLLISGSKVTSWNPDTGTCTLVIEYADIELDRLLANKKQICIFGLHNQLIYLYNLESRKTETINCMHGEENRGISGRRKFLPISYDKGCLIVFSMYYNSFFFIKNGRIEKEIELFTTDIPDIDFNELLCQHMKTESRFYRCSLENYLNYIINQKNKNKPSPYKNVGDQVYQEICSL